MSNWVECVLEITGAPDTVNDCLASIGSTESDEAVGLCGTNWYMWGIDVERPPDGAAARIQFRTKAIPPLPVVETLADQFPSLGFDLRFMDQQWPFAGRRRRVPSHAHWATTDAEGDYGFCRAAFEAESWDPFEDDTAPARG